MEKGKEVKLIYLNLFISFTTCIRIFRDFKYSPIIVVGDQKNAQCFLQCITLADRNRTLRGQPKMEIKTLSKCLLRITVL